MGQRHERETRERGNTETREKEAAASRESAQGSKGLGLIVRVSKKIHFSGTDCVETDCSV